MEVISVLYTAASLLIFFIAALFVYVTALVAWTHAKYDHIPGPKRTSFYFGNVHEMRSTIRNHDDDYTDETKIKLKPLRHKKFVEWAEQYGDTYVLFILHRALIITRDPETVKNILVTGDQRDFPKVSDLGVRVIYGVRYLGDGLVTAVDHDAWYLRRKVLDPVFHRNQLRLSVDVFNATGDHFIEELGGYAESGQSVKLNPILHLTTLDVIMKAMFSIDTCNLGSDFHKQAKQLLEVTFDGIQKSGIPFIKYNPMFHKHRQSVRNCLLSFRKLAAEIINDRKSAISNGDSVPADLLTTMINASMEPSSGYTLDIMIDEFLTIIIAGMETSANTLGFVFMELGRRSELLERLVHEVDEVVGKKSFVSNEDITKLAFTSTLIKESLRLYPPAGSIARTASKETVLNGLRIPANSNIIINIMGANRNERYVEDAEKFIPDRFDPNQDKRVSVGSLFSFSLGPRNCIGQVFAQMEMKVMIAKFFQHYEFVLDKSETFEIGQTATLYPHSGLKCTVRARR